ncbi:MAG TPA: maltose alpha-D-glucosyltransferase [Candidatus Limnocylindrales bacterium]|nr:maltose alpha-D-glucosyltransferase [Candidatus Limnocylindrales bacterium]
MGRPPDTTLDDDPLWYKDAIIYELHVRAFYDSNDDGIGDFPGLIQKLDYLEELGVTAIWLLPFYPSPLRDDGYDIADYRGVNPIYGKLGDLRDFVREAHRRGMRVITELVCNHTSDQHPWFQRARRAPPGSAFRNYYVWSTTNQKYQDARIIFKDFEISNWTWDHVAGAYYWHRFYSHQPDLNFDNPQVVKEIHRAVDFWMDMEIDGLRLDAVPYLYEREGTNCENLPETHALLRQLRKHIDSRYRNRMLLAEANQWPEDAVAYLGQGAECNMAFHFPLMPRLFMAIRMEDRFPIVDILAQTPAISDSAQWALFLRNHDELTLEMVTHEERGYMYQVYTQDPEARINLGIRRRLAPLLGNNRRRIELMNALLFSLPGTPVLYYGDEIGMGDNIYLGDRNGVRTPMQWSPDRNAGFSGANRQRLFLPVIVDPEYHYEAVNVEAQRANPYSLLNWTRRLIGLRKQYKAFGRGTFELVRSENRKLLAFIRSFKGEQILVVANLSRFTQAAELDLAAYAGQTPIELWGRTELPVITERPYFLTLGPHAFYWFALEARAALTVTTDLPRPGAHLPIVGVKESWEEVIAPRQRVRQELMLPTFLRQRRWFGGKARRIKSAHVGEIIPMPWAGGAARLCLVDVEYVEGEQETYAVPLAYAQDRDGSLEARSPDALVARVEGPDGLGLIYDALADPGFCQLLLQTIARRRRLKGAFGVLTGVQTRAFKELHARSDQLEVAPARAEQSNSSVVFGERLILKVFRRVEAGINPELEIGRFLTERTTFRQIAPVGGSLEYRPARGEGRTLAVLTAYVPNQGDAWSYTLNELAEFYSRASGTPRVEIVGEYLQAAALLGRRTGELHLALASDADDPDFVPEPTTKLDQRSFYQSVRRLSGDVFQLLRQQLDRLPATVGDRARSVLGLQAQIEALLRSALDRPISARRIRCHGDYHLGQVLRVTDDFVIIDFEGEPDRTLAERRLKRWALRDVAGMLRSFEYAAYAGLHERDRHEEMQPWSRVWVGAVSQAFLAAYRQTVSGATFMNGSEEEIAWLLQVLLLEKALYELRYELNNRPDWVDLPLRGLLDLMGNASLTSKP